MRIFLFVLLAAMQLTAADFLAYRRTANTFLIQTNDGVAELEWISGAAFRYARRPAPQVGRTSAQTPVAIGVSEQNDQLRLITKHLNVSIFKSGMQIQVQDTRGKLIAAFADGAIEREFDLRKHPFFFAGSGYGLGKTRLGDCYFFYGPSPKEILEQRNSVNDPLTQLDYKDVRLLDPASLPRQATRLRAAGEPNWETLGGILRETAENSMGGVLLSALNLTAWDAAPEPVRHRAMQLASVFPLIYATKPLSNLKEIEALRPKLHSYLVTYFWEARERGFPLLRPLALQYPLDPRAAEEQSVFMLGDELLIAPILSTAPKRSFYLPQGVWTDLATNQKYTGRRVLEIDAPDYLPVFLRNGSILSLDGNPMQLHYTPMLGGELFLYEPDLDDYSQLHAGPAGDFMRLEMESKVSRDYEWVIHHVDRPKLVERAGRWSYDEKARNLHVFASAPAGGDVIINIRF